MGSQTSLSDKFRPNAPPPYQPTPPYRSSPANRQQQPPPPPYQLEPLQTSRSSPRTSIGNSTRNPYDIDPMQPLQHSTPIYDHNNHYSKSSFNASVNPSNIAFNQSMSKTDQRTPPSVINRRYNPRIPNSQQNRTGDNSDSCHSGFDSPRGSTSSRSEGGDSFGPKNLRYDPQHLQNKDSFSGPSHPHYAAGGSHYDDVAIFKSAEPCSHVSSSTDSGYGHVYEKVDVLMQQSGKLMIFDFWIPAFLWINCWKIAIKYEISVVWDWIFSVLYIYFIKLIKLEITALEDVLNLKKKCSLKISLIVKDEMVRYIKSKEWLYYQFSFHCFF